MRRCPFIILCRFYSGDDPRCRAEARCSVAEVAFREALRLIAYELLKMRFGEELTEKYMEVMG
jgi:hypothetical protein